MTAAIVAGLLLCSAVLACAAWAQRREIDRLDKLRCASAADAWRYQLALLHIEQHGLASKSGTARMMARIAREAVEGM